MKKITFTELEDGVYYSDEIIDCMDNTITFEDDVKEALRKFFGDYTVFPGTVKGVYRTTYTDVVIELAEDGSIKISLASEQE